MNETTINGVEYAPIVKTSSSWVLVRSGQAGVFAGRLISKVGDEVVLHDARRIWYGNGTGTGNGYGNGNGYGDGDGTGTGYG